MRRPQGYAVITDPGDANNAPSVKEFDTITCVHCNAVFFIKPKQPLEEVGGFCTLCNRQICKKCTDLGGCDHFEKKLERMEAAGRLVEAAGVK